MIIIFQIIGVVAIVTAFISYFGIKIAEWWECRK